MVASAHEFRDMPCFDNKSASVRRQKTGTKHQAEVKHPKEAHDQSVDALETDGQPSLLIGRLGSRQSLPSTTANLDSCPERGSFSSRK